MKLKYEIIGIKRIRFFVNNSAFKPHTSILLSPHAELSNLAKAYLVEQNIEVLKPFWRSKIRLRRGKK